MITRDTILTRYDYFKRPADGAGNVAGGAAAASAHAKGESLKRGESLPKGESLSRGKNAAAQQKGGETLQMERLNPTQGDHVSEDDSQHNSFLQNNSAT